MGEASTLQLLASLTRLTMLDLSGTAVAAGLRHLTRLKDLASLGLKGCEKVKDKHLQHLSALTGLTILDASATGMQGGSLAALTSLRCLDASRCSSLDTAALSAVAQLTRLTHLRLSYCATGAAPAQLAQLGQLTNLQAVRLWDHNVRDQAAALLLQLPRLGQLCAGSLAVPPGQDVSRCAFTACREAGNSRCDRAAGRVDDHGDVCYLHSHAASLPPSCLQAAACASSPALPECGSGCAGGAWVGNTAGRPTHSLGFQAISTRQSNCNTVHTALALTRAPQILRSGGNSRPEHAQMPASPTCTIYHTRNQYTSNPLTAVSKLRAQGA